MRMSDVKFIKYIKPYVVLYVVALDDNSIMFVINEHGKLKGRIARLQEADKGQFFIVNDRRVYVGELQEVKY